MARLELINLSKRYGEHTVVAGVTLDVADGEFLVLLGPSGCGKTTTLRMIAGFIEPSAGATRIGGVDVTWRPPWHRNTGMVFQSYALFPHMTAAENVAFGLEMRKLAKAEIASRAREALRLVRLEAYAERLPRQLSGGQQQRVALARALATRPRRRLLDEPRAALDVGLRERIQPNLMRVRDEWKTPVLYVTHNVGEALALSRRMLLLRDGRVEADGAPFELLATPAMASAAEPGVENLFSGRVRGHDVEGGVTILDLASGQGMTVPLAAALTPGSAVTVAVRAEDVIVARKAPEGLSARNLFEVRIVALARAGADVTLRCAPPGGEGKLEWIVRVTPSAATSLGLAVGQAAYLAVKSHSVRLV